MVDLFYIAGTIGFFALMVAYARFCAHLGASEANTTEPSRVEGSP